MAIIRYQGYEAYTTLSEHFPYRLSPYRDCDPTFDWHATYHAAREWCEEQFGPEAKFELPGQDDVLVGIEIYECDTSGAWANAGTEWFFNDLTKAVYFKLRWC